MDTKNGVKSNKRALKECASAALENDHTLKSLMKILDAKSSTEGITASRRLASPLFGPGKIEDLASGI